MNTVPDRLKGRAKVCPACWGEGTVEVNRAEPTLHGFLGAMRLPCDRCKMLGWIVESEIDCEATDGW